MHWNLVKSSVQVQFPSFMSTEAFEWAHWNGFEMVFYMGKRHEIWT